MSTLGGGGGISQNLRRVRSKDKLRNQCFVMRAGFRIVVDCHDPPRTPGWATPMEALVKEAVPHPKLLVVQRGGGALHPERNLGSLRSTYFTVLARLRLEQTSSNGRFSSVCMRVRRSIAFLRARSHDIRHKPRDN